MPDEKDPSLPLPHDAIIEQLTTLFRSENLNELRDFILNAPKDQQIVDNIFQQIDRKISLTIKPERYLSLVEALEQKQFPFSSSRYIQLYSDILKNVLETSRDDFIDVFIKISAHPNAQEIFTNWLKAAESFNEKEYAFLIQKFSTLAVDAQHTLLAPLMTLALEQNLPTFVANLKPAFPEIYEQLPATQKTSNLAQMVSLLEPISDPRYSTFCIKHLGEIDQGFGHIKEQSGKLVLAAVIHDKSLTPPPTLLESDPESDTEIERYIQALKKATPPLCERFVISGIHWLAGQIEIDANGHASLFILDSLGIFEKMPHVHFSKPILQQFAKTFPQHDIYISSESRQQSDKGCSAFALDDVRHLYTVANYLKPEQTLFQYLASQNKPPITALGNGSKSLGFQIHIAHLPLSLLRTMQSTYLLSLMEKSPEAEHALNKAKMTGRVFKETQSGFVTRETKEGPKLQNARLEDKLKKMMNRTLNYVKSHDFNAVQQQMRRCSLAGFEERMKEREQTQEQPHPKSP